MSDEQTGQELQLLLKLRIAGNPKDPTGWQIALVLDRRIDGFDYEHRFCDIHGNEQSGWHRHLWNANSQSAEVDRIAVSLFDKADMSFEGFLVRALRHMNIVLSRDDDDGNLPF
jgi:hypothetical protein